MEYAIIGLGTFIIGVIFGLFFGTERVNHDSYLIGWHKGYDEGYDDCYNALESLRSRVEDKS